MSQSATSQRTFHWQGVRAILKRFRAFSGVAKAVLAVSFLVVVVLALYRLPEYPLTWFDEGSHLHVPKALVLFGVYADYSSEGFRYFGPTNGVGPTVLLPIAGVFSLFGIGLTQARIVMAMYLIAAVVAFYLLGSSLGGRKLAWIATAMLVASRGAPLLEYGRQVLGEVPALLFAVLGLLVWFSSLDRPGVGKEILAGALFGLAAVTKQQELLVVAPMLAAGWLANAVYYRQAGHRFFVLPGIVALAMYGAWQATLLTVLSHQAISESLHLLNDSVGGAALVFSPALMVRGIRELLDAKVYMGALAPALLFICFSSRHRTTSSFRWFLLVALIVGNLGWYVLASLSWARYAFPGLALGALAIASLLSSWTDDFRLPRVGRSALSSEPGHPLVPESAFRWAGLGWAALIILVPLSQTVGEIVSPPAQTPVAMARYIDEHVPASATIETWEPEIGFLSDHRFHYPPPSMLNKAVAHIWLGGPPPSQSYSFLEEANPEYVLIGKFAKWVDVYRADTIDDQYRQLEEIGDYDLYQRR